MGSPNRTSIQTPNTRASSEQFEDTCWDEVNPRSLNTSHNSLETVHEEIEEEIITSESVVIQGVKIDPAKLQFINTFEGKKFQGTVTIQNCGPNSAFIKYDGPTNKAFRFKSLRCGKRLSSGMKFNMCVSYTYAEHSALSTYSIPIFINDEMFPVKVFVTAPVAKVSVHPTQIDFGLIDVGYNISKRTVTLKNTGSQHCRFNIDIVNQDVQLRIKPMKGMLQPYSETTISIEVISLDEGDFTAYFIIQCVKQIRVFVTGTVMVSKLEICNIPSCNDFTLMEFPRTYYNTKCTQRLILRNNSASRTVFCVLFNNNEEDQDEDKCFFISPMDGRLEPREARIFTIEYIPKFVNKNRSYHFAVATIKKLNFWKDMNVTDYPNGLYETLRQNKMPEMQHTKTSMNALNGSIKGFSFSNKSDFSYMSYHEMFMEQPLIDAEHSIKVYLHGEPERVDITKIPDQINVFNLTLNQPVDRTITIKNNSKYLSVKLSYEKAAYINVLPKTCVLQPSKSIELKVTINVCKLGKICTNIILLIFKHSKSSTNGVDDKVQVGKIMVPVTLEANCHILKRGVTINTGITPTYLKEVGINADLIPYNKKNVLIPRQTIDPTMRKQRRDDTAFIAFPNDMPKSLRPWTLKSNEMVTVYAKIPRGIASSNSLHNLRNELAIRDQTREYYSNYLKYSRMDLLKVLKNSSDLPEYEVTKLQKFLVYRYFTDFLGDTSLVTSNDGMINAFIPLTPLQLNKIKIEPVHIAVALVAPYSKTSKSFSVTNDNDASIRVYIIPEKQRFTFPNGEGMIVKAHACKQVDFTFFSEYEGMHSLCIRIVINECHIFEVIVHANVISKRLVRTDHHFMFKADDAPFKFINLYNPLNVHVDFVWMPSDSNFSIQPSEGKIPPGKGMACLLTYDPLRNNSNAADLVFQTSRTHKQHCTVKAEPPVISTHLCELDIDFGLVPMNIKTCKQAVLWNLSNCSIHFSISKPTMSGVQIVPENGFLKNKTSQIFSIKLKSLNCLPFSYKVVIEVNGKPTHEMVIRGCVIFPNVKYSPNPWKLKRFPVTSFIKFCVNVENKTNAPIVFAFDFQQGMNCIIADSKDGDRYNKAKITLEPKQSKFLYVQLDPKYVTCLWFNMPFVLNNILGPPEGSLNITKKDTCALNPDKAYVSFMKVFTIISESDFHISNYDLDFYYHPYDVIRSICEEKITVKNISTKELEFCIRLDTVHVPFYVSHDSGNDIYEHPASITFILQPEDHTTLMVRFKPDEVGSFYNTAAFYVRDDYQEGIHNYIRLKAVYELPIITVPKTTYFEYIPLRFKFEKSFFIHNKNHGPACILKTEFEHANLQVLLKEEYRTETVHKYEVCIIYTSYCSECFNTIVTFTCNCGGTATMDCIGVAENSLFTTFKIANSANEAIVFSQTQSRLSEMTFGIEDTISHIVANDSNTFPYFPEKGDTDHEILLETLHFAESWIFCQGFFGKLRFKIPDSFSMLMPIPRTTDVDPKKVLTQELRYIIPYMELLKQIASKGIAEQIGLTVSNTTEEGLARELFFLYSRVLEFLKKMKACLPHVEPELLLNYGQYITYFTRIKNNRSKLAMPITSHSEYNFYLLSKQAWLDVILQTLKIFIVGRIKVPSDSSELFKLKSKINILVEDETTVTDMRKKSMIELNRIVSQKSIDFLSKIENNEFVDHHIFSATEHFLLHWVKHNYTCYINEICNEDLESMIEKPIDDYGSSFMDSLVLATVIVAHCPYLKFGLSSIYSKPASTEQFHHNAAVVVETLTQINSTFELMPRNIYNPNSIQMILLVSYLYEFLPYLYPRNVITITSKLSTSSLIRITINNDNNFDVTYRVMFFENEHGCFSENLSMVKVSSKSTNYLGVRFHARFIRKVAAVLILCGEVAGTKCARSIAYRLIGEPDVTHVISRFDISGKYYTSQEHALDVQAPYKVSGCYDIYLTYDKPTTCQNLDLIDCCTIMKDRLISRFNFIASQAFFNEQGESTLFLNCVNLTGRSRSVWLFYRNAEIGDFCIYIVMKTLETKEVEYIYANIPHSVYDQKCICAEKGSKNCKKFVMIKVPKTNKLMMEIFKREFIKLKGVNIEFWTSYLEKPAAMRHMRMSLTGHHSMDVLRILHYLTEEKNFDVTVTDIGKNVGSTQEATFPKTLTISNVEYGNLQEFEPLYVHVGNQPMSNFQLNMYSKEMPELRKYKVIVRHLQ